MSRVDIPALPDFLFGNGTCACNDERMCVAPLILHNRLIVGNDLHSFQSMRIYI